MRFNSSLLIALSLRIIAISSHNLPVSDTHRSLVHRGFRAAVNDWGRRVGLQTEFTTGSSFSAGRNDHHTIEWAREQENRDALVHLDWTELVRLSQDMFGPYARVSQEAHSLFLRFKDLDPESPEYKELRELQTTKHEQMDAMKDWVHSYKLEFVYEPLRSAEQSGQRRVRVSVVPSTKPTDSQQFGTRLFTTESGHQQQWFTRAIPNDEMTPEILAEVAEGGSTLDKIIAYYKRGKQNIYTSEDIDAAINAVYGARSPLAITVEQAGLSHRMFQKQVMERVWDRLYDQNAVAAKKRLRKRVLPNKRDNSLDAMVTQESDSASGSTNSTTSTGNQFVQDLEAFQLIQANITDQLLPVLNELVNLSNDTLVRSIAWSIWSDITMSSIQIDGPFMYGLSALTSIEGQYFHNNTNVTAMTANSTVDVPTNDTTSIAIVAITRAIEQLYFLYWEKAVSATNITGLLSVRDNLVYQLASHNGSSDASTFLNTPYIPLSGNSSDYSQMYPPLQYLEANNNSNSAAG